MIFFFLDADRAPQLVVLQRFGLVKPVFYTYIMRAIFCKCFKPNHPTERETERERQKERDKERETERDRERQRERQGERDNDRERDIERE